LKVNNWKQIFESFKNTKVLIVGDAMIDAYMWGKINRQSPEAPIPIVDIVKHEKRLGGAANVATNIKALGAQPILCAVIGHDDKGFIDLMKNEGLSIDGILQENRKTTVKTRIISEDKHQLRVDEEDTFSIQKEEDFIHNTQLLMKNSDVVIFQDYNKGVLSKNVIQQLILFANKHQISILVDPKKDHYWHYTNVDLFKPNFKELNDSSNNKIHFTDLKNLSDLLSQQRQKLNAKQMLVTLSEKGVFIQNQHQNLLFPAFERNIVDVSGAGDAVISTAALALVSGLNSEKIAQLANLAGGLACEKVGVNPIDKNLLLKEASRLI
jgi:rfaE bifunctional protein kinase chain/domain